MARYGSMGMELTAGIVGMVLLGYWIDWQFGTGRAGLITGAVFGAVGGFYRLIQQALAMQREAEEAARQSAERKTRNDDCEESDDR